MIDAIMPWRLLFLSAACLLVTASLPQPSGGERKGVRLPSTCVQLSRTEEVVAITSLNNVLAVASRFQATIHTISGSRQLCKQTEEIKFPTQIDKFTEFKLLNETSLFYCDISSCAYCNFGQEAAWRVLNIQFEKKDYEINSAAATQSTDAMTISLKIVFSTHKGVLFRYSGGKLDGKKVEYFAKANDPEFFEWSQVATGFNVDGFSYFVTSSFQPYEPAAIRDPYDGDRKDYRVKISRICDGDKTDENMSKIDISLACPGIDNYNNRGVAAATYSPNDRKVIVVFSTASTDDVVCSYSIDDINKQMEHTWNVCQNVSEAVRKSCTGAQDYREHCNIISRLDDKTAGCARYALNFDLPAYELCYLDEYKSSAYKYGLLESYISVNGTPMALIDNRGHKYNRVFMDEWHSSLFFTGDDRMARVPAKFDGNKKNNMLRTAPSLVEFYKPTSRFAMAHVTSSSFLLIDHDRVEEHDISCTSLYRSCDALAKGGFSDPLKCLFCALPDDEFGGFVMEREEKSSCQKPLFEKCPPVIREAYQSADRREEWVITGDSLQTLGNPRVLVCEQHCVINIAQAGEKRFTCTLQSSSVLDATCSVKFEGLLENYQKFSVAPVKSTRDSATQTQPISGQSSSSSSGMSRNWKIVIAVVAIILILGIIIIIILGARKYLGVSSSHNLRYMRPGFAMRNQKGNGSIGVPFETINSYPRNSAARNTYLSTDPSGMPFAMSPGHAPAYERLFREIDARLKIPSDHLLLEKQIGKGHFGVVIKGTYNPVEGAPRAVACKTLSGHVSGGISEFVNEGLMMDRFDHPRVMTLVGISFNEDRMPIIVTDYMENGDLAKYLRDVKNKPTLRDLLNFTHEIAQGMQYLHDNKFIHRDLAARNCMLDRDLHVKIADFGLCREATSQDEYLPLHSGREMPLRWMAPEALEREQFTMAGDVWAFGVVIWEVMTRGMNPYPNLQAYVLFDFLKAGKRMGKPDFCPDILFRVMLDCWHGEPTLRPTFKELPTQIEEIIDVLSSNSRVQMNAEYEQCNSVRNSRSASSSATTPITHHAISHVHSLPMEQSPTPV